MVRFEVGKSSYLGSLDFMANKRNKFLDNGARADVGLKTQLQEYFRVHDMDYGTNRLDIFNALYASEEKLTHDEIACKFFISDTSLRRIIKKTNILAEKLSNTK